MGRFLTFLSYFVVFFFCYGEFKTDKNDPIFLGWNTPYNFDVTVL